MLKKEQLILELIEKNINTKANTYIENLSILLGMMVGKDYNRYIQDIEKDTFNSNLDEKISRYIKSICREININNLEELEKIYGYNYEYIELNILKFMWALIWNFKDIFLKINKFKILIITIHF